VIVAPIVVGKAWRIVEDKPRADGKAGARTLQGAPRTGDPLHRFGRTPNCPQHIAQRFEAADVATALNDCNKRIAALEAEIARLRADLLREAAWVK
jgi:hypothetical protein